MNPLISVICLCYNQSKFIVESLESIKNQTFQNFEILIIDDFSKDESVEVIDKWIRANPQLAITFIKHLENKGICRSLNELLEISKGKYIQMLALDDVLLPWKLEKHAEVLDNSQSNEVLVFSDALLMDDESNLYQNKFIAYQFKYLKIETGNFFETLVSQNFIPAMSVLIKKDEIIKVGGWDEELTYEDYDMWLRLSKNGLKFIFDDEPSCVYRLHSNNAHKNRVFLRKSMFKLYVKHIDNDLVLVRLKTLVISLFMDGHLSKVERKLFFKKVKPEKVSELFVKHNMPVFFLKLLNVLKL